MTIVQKLLFSLAAAALFAQSLAALVGPATVENLASTNPVVADSSDAPTPAS